MKIVNELGVFYCMLPNLKRTYHRNITYQSLCSSMGVFSRLTVILEKFTFQSVLDADDKDIIMQKFILALKGMRKSATISLKCALLVHPAFLLRKDS